MVGSGCADEDCSWFDLHQSNIGGDTPTTTTNKVTAFSQATQIYENFARRGPKSALTAHHELVVVVA